MTRKEGNVYSFDSQKEIVEHVIIIYTAIIITYILTYKIIVSDKTNVTQYKKNLGKIAI